MIGVVSLNPALDVTYEVGRVEWAGVNRPDVVHVKAGGKGVNVARTLAALGSPVRLLGLAEPSFAARLAKPQPQLEAQQTHNDRAAAPAESQRRSRGQIEIALTAIAGETRRTVTIVDRASGHAALFNEPGPFVSEGEFAEFFVHYEKAVRDCSMIVLSGSLPGNVAASAYADLIEAAGSVPVLLDTSGPALSLGAVAGPALVKPNLAELSAATGDLVHEPEEIERAARRLGDGAVARNGGVVVVSLGARGLLAVGADRSWHAWPSSGVTGNPTGAGDAVVAGLAHFADLDWPERLRHAVALGTATVLGRTAGEFSLAEYERQLELVEVRS